MPIPAPLIAAGASLAFKGLGSIFGGKAKRKQEKANKQAATNAANIRQKQSEDQRRARLQFGASIANSLPAHRGAGVDPKLLESLMQERTYDFGSAIPESAGGADAFLSGLFGDAADMVPDAYGAGIFGKVPVPGGINPGAGVGGLTIEELLEMTGQSGARRRARAPRTGPAPLGGNGFEGEREY